MTRRAVPPAPAGLSEASAALWPGLAADVLAVAGGAEVDFLLLAELLHAMDRLAQVRAALAADGVTVAGSRGQARPHPLLATEVTLAGRVTAITEQLQLAPGLDRSNWYAVSADGRIIGRP